MKILLATHFFPPGHAGGTEAYTFGLARKLLERGHTPIVLCAEDWGNGDTWIPRYEDSTYEGVTVRRLYWNWQLAPNPFVNLYDNPAVDRHFASFLAQVEPDVVHVTSCYTLGAGIIRASHAVGLPTLLTLTDFWFLCPRHTLLRGDGSLCKGPENDLTCQACLASTAKSFQVLRTVLPANAAARLFVKVSHIPVLARQRGLRGFVGDTEARLSFLRATFEDVDVALAPSRFLRETFVRNGFPSTRIRVSPYGLDLSWLAQLRPRARDGRVRFGYIGQIERLKGVDVLVKAYTSLPANASADLLIFGDPTKNPTFGDELRRLAAGKPAVRFLGPFERSQIAEVLSQIDVVVAPSIWYENTPIVIYEAFAAQKPVIATNLGGMSEVVTHEVNGLLFERGDVLGLAQAMFRFVDDAALADQLKKGIEPVRNVNEEVDSLIELYEQVRTHQQTNNVAAHR